MVLPTLFSISAEFPTLSVFVLTMQTYYKHETKILSHVFKKAEP